MLEPALVPLTYIHDGDVDIGHENYPKNKTHEMAIRNNKNMHKQKDMHTAV